MKEMSLDEIDRVIQYFRRWPFPLTIYTVKVGQPVPGKLAKFLHWLGFHFFQTGHWDKSGCLNLALNFRFCYYPGCFKRQEKTNTGWEDY